MNNVRIGDLENIVVFFRLNQIDVKILANREEMFVAVAWRFMQKIGLTQAQTLIKFFHNGRKLLLESAKTIDEYGIKNNNIIDVIEFPSF